MKKKIEQFEKTIKEKQFIIDRHYMNILDLETRLSKAEEILADLTPAQLSESFLTILTRYEKIAAEASEFRSYKRPIRTTLGGTSGSVLGKW